MNKLSRLFTKMRRLRQIYFMALFCVGFISCADKSESKISFSIENVDIKHFSEIGRIDKVIKLESTTPALFSYADRIKVDSDGHLYILNKDSQNSLFHFDSKGKFINKFGRFGQGPGEYNSLLGFDLDSSENVYLLTESKIIKLDKSGTYLKEIRSDCFSQDVKEMGNTLYVFVLRQKGMAGQNKYGINVYDSDLNSRQGISSYDSRLNKYCIYPYNILDGLGNKLFFVDMYDLIFNVYDLKTKETMQARFPNRNSMLKNLWDKPVLNEEDRDKIRKNTHRFVRIYCYKKGLYLYEHCINMNIFNFWLVDLEKNTIKKYPFFKLCGKGGKSRDEFLFDYIAGSYEDGLILVVDDYINFQKYKDRFPELKNIEFREDDNPLIVFFKLNENVQ